MVKHSREEVLACGYIQYALFGQSDAQSIFAAVKLGDSYHLSDMAFEFVPTTADQTTQTYVFLIEYDGGFHHGADRLASDLKKTRALLDTSPNIFVIRLRNSGAAGFPDIRNNSIFAAECWKRCVVISDLPQCSNGCAAASIAKEVQRACAQLLRTQGVSISTIGVSSVNKSKLLDQESELALRKIDAQRGLAYTNLKLFAKGDIEFASHMCNVPGVVMRADAVCIGLQTLMNLACDERTL